MNSPSSSEGWFQAMLRSLPKDDERSEVNSATPSQGRLVIPVGEDQEAIWRELEQQ